MELMMNSTSFFDVIVEDENSNVVAIRLFIAALCLCLVIGHLLQEYRWLNESITAILVVYFTFHMCHHRLKGFIVGTILLTSKWKSSHLLRFNEELFFIYLLPPIIFNAGFQVKKKQFFHNFFPIMLFGVTGVLISTSIVTAVLYAHFSVIVIGGSWCCLGCWWMFPKFGFEGIGTIFSSTDTVCTLQVLSQEETPLLYSLVFGEGVVNDATSVVLFNAVQKINADTINGLTALHIFLNFLYLFTTSTVLGVAAGLVTAYILRGLYFGRHSSVREISLMVLVAYLSYMLAELFELSGILTVFFTGVLMSHYSWHNVTESSRITTRHVWYAFAALSFIAETFIFLYVGMDALDYEKWKVSALSFGTRMEIYSTVMFLIALGRAAFVFPLSILSNYMHRSGGESSKISGHHQMVIWWAGLMRGAVSIALTFKQFTHSGITMDPTNATMITTTIVIVLFSTIVFGFMTKPLVDYLLPQTALSTKRNPNPQDPGSPKEDMTLPLLSLEESASENLSRAKENVSMLMDRPVYTIHSYWRRFDHAYMRPIFGGPSGDESSYSVYGSKKWVNCQNRMEQKQSLYGGSVCHQLPPLSEKYPWFVAQNLGADEDSSRDQYFYTLHDPLTKYQCQIPELLGRRIRGYYHGWVILSDHLQNVMWSLWNPVTSKMIHFPALPVKDGDSESICECCLSAPPDDPSSILLLTRTNKPTFVFFRLVGKRRHLKWIEMSYTSQLKRITGEDGDFLHNLTCCNGKIYALSRECSFTRFIIQLDILVKDKEVLIKFLLLGSEPGYCTELFYIEVGFSEKRVDAVYLFKLDMTSVKSKDMEKFKGLDMSCKSWRDLEDISDILGTLQLWEQLFDLEDAIFFVDLGRDNLAYYRPGIASELGVLPTSNVSVWECRFDDHGGAKSTLDSKQEKSQIVVTSVTDNEIGLDEWNLLNLPFDILGMIMEHCVCVEYLNFRATCKHCEVAAPLIQWSNKTSLMRLQTYSLVSPWLMVVDNDRGIITFTDPMLGDNYFMKNLHVSIPRHQIFCSRFGWLFFFSFDIQRLVLYNLFTCDLRKLPDTSYGFDAACFSAPPTSPDCMVAGFSIGDECLVLIHYVARESSWRTIRVGAEPDSIRFLTFFGQDLYALDGDGKLIGFKELGEENYSLTFVEATVPISCSTSPAQYYLMKCDQDILKVIVGKFGERVEVFKRDVSIEEWEKIDSLGNHIIYICDTTCLCIEAKTREMENKVCFPRLQSKNTKMLFYSLETCTYQTYNGENIQQKDFFGTTYHLSPHAWIEPNWT
ncbi:cation/H+ exchanger, Cation/H+ exchanger, CPA1 family [Artemisia annua]|uniref:Cation/H+ exchanger, Cation/H+ exchanger, CPA1 family n=1 Tax=Artemisia annua TaxID=35608 RepID=A0A2U1NMM5_ARTAN|nr:cation/H+ exchanger, Cation/H+ exchanger, CPA1 family [Artemisia annua]